MRNESYRHRQRGTTILAWMLATVAFNAVVFGGLAWVLPEARTPLWWVWVGTTALLLALGWLFGSLEVAVTDASVDLAFGPGWPRKSIPLASIEAARPVRNSWWHGWGIRLTPHGWLWNVAGLDAVELELADGRPFRIGTDEPSRLAEAISTASGG